MNGIHGSVLVLATLVLSGCATRNSYLEAQFDRETLKRELRFEILTELRDELDLRFSDRQQLREELAPILATKPPGVVNPGAVETAFPPPPQAVRTVTGPVGNAQGQMLRSGTGLEKCRVKLVRLTGERDLGNMIKTFKTGAEFDTVTDANGNYRFEALPVGQYKIKWELPGDKGWIRRLRDKPDVTVMAEGTSTLKPIETARSLVPR